MADKVISLNGWRAARASRATSEVAPSHSGWDMNMVVALSIAGSSPPKCISVRWRIELDPLRPRWRVTLCREGWQVVGSWEGEDRSTLALLDGLLQASLAE